jgi:hypothetical protein
MLGCAAHPPRLTSYFYRSFSSFLHLPFEGASFSQTVVKSSPQYMVPYLAEQNSELGEANFLGNWKYGRARSAQVYNWPSSVIRFYGRPPHSLHRLSPSNSSVNVSVSPKNNPDADGLGGSTCSISACGLVSYLCFIPDAISCFAYPGLSSRWRYPRSDRRHPDEDDNRKFCWPKRFLVLTRSE